MTIGTDRQAALRRQGARCWERLLRQNVDEMIELGWGAEAKFGCVELHMQKSEPLMRDGRRNRRIEGVRALHRAMNPECNRRYAPVGLVAEVNRPGICGGSNL
jgi:hypothetical protein